MIKLLFGAALIGLLLSLGACGQSSSAIPTKKLQRALDETVTSSGIPGVTAGVYLAGDTWFGASGFADVAAGRRLRPSDQMRLASITKTLAATLVMKEVELGQLRLDQTLEELLPATGIANSERITLHMLLSHTAGVFDFSNESVEFAQALHEDPSHAWTPAEIYAWIRSGTPGEPGGEFHYSNGGYYLLGPILERATGRTVSDLFNQYAAATHHLTRTELDPAGTLTEPFALPYYFDPTTQTVVDSAGWNLSWDWCAGSAVSSARDMIEFGRALFSGEILSPAVVGLMTQQHAQISDTQWYGYGLFVRPDMPDYQGTVYWHGGDSEGTTTMLGGIPGLDAVVFIGINRMDGPPADHPPVDAITAKMELFKRFGRILTGQE